VPVVILSGKVPTAGCRWNRPVLEAVEEGMRGEVRKMHASHVREVAVVVGMATAGVLTVALIVLGSVALLDGPRFPQVTQLHPPPQPQP
jgi:hypothetical protein